MYTLNKECPICGTYITGRSDKQYCSSRCRVASHREGNPSNEEPEEQDEQAGGHGQLDSNYYQESKLSGWQPSPRASDSVDEKIDLKAMIPASITRYDDQEAAAKVVRQQQADVALAKTIHAVYVNIIESFLDYENRRLDSNTLQELAEGLVDAREDYKAHPYLSQSGHVARLRLNDLRDALLVVQETQQEMESTWLSGFTGRYELKGKWRKQLRERLLE